MIGVHPRESRPVRPDAAVQDGVPSSAATSRRDPPVQADALATRPGISMATVRGVRKRTARPRRLRVRREALSRHCRGNHRADHPESPVRRRRCGDPPRRRPTHPLPPGASGTARSDLSGGQVPDDGPGRRRAARRPSPVQRGQRQCVLQDDQRPADHAGSEASSEGRASTSFHSSGMSFAAR